MFEILAFIAIGAVAAYILPEGAVSGEKYARPSEADFQALWALELKHSGKSKRPGLSRGVLELINLD